MVTDKNNNRDELKRSRTAKKCPSADGLRSYSATVDLMGFCSAQRHSILPPKKRAGVDVIKLFLEEI